MTKNLLFFNRKFCFSLYFLILFFYSAPFIDIAFSQTPAGNEEIKIEKISKMYEWYRKWFFSKAKSITVKEFLELQREEEVILVDNRSEKERGISMIPSAISQKVFESRKESMRNKKIIVYCTIGFRSGRYSQRLMKQGFDAYNLKGGILSWAHNSQKFMNEDGATFRVHVHGKKWSLLPEGYQAVY